MEESKNASSPTMTHSEAPDAPVAHTSSGHGVSPMMEWFDVLSQLPLFSQLTMGQLKTIYHLCEVCPFEEGALLIQANEVSESLWVLLEGEANVLSPKNNRVLATLNPGDHVGEMGLLESAPANATVTTTSAGKVLRLDRSGFQGALAADDQFALRIYRIFLGNLSSRLRHTTEMVG